MVAVSALPVKHILSFAVRTNKVFIFATRAAGKEGESDRGIKRSIRENSFPPGHILHYPLDDSQEGLHHQTYTHIQTQAIKTQHPIKT